MTILIWETVSLTLEKVTYDNAQVFMAASMAPDYET